MDDYVMHMTRRSLLDYVLEQSALAPKKPPPSRLVYAAASKHKDSGKYRLTNYHADMLQKAAGKIERVTGFLLIYPTCCIHLIEAETSVLMAVLKALQSDKSFIESICILSFTEDVPQRSFSGWLTGFINSSNLGPYEAFQPNAVLRSASELNINLLKWGKHLSEMDKAQQNAVLDSVRSAGEEFLPDDPGTVFGIILSEEVPKLDEVLELLDSPPEDIIFDSELVWPKPQLPFKLV